MDTGIEASDVCNSNYFELFQDQNKYSERILEKAKQIKEQVQEIYNSIDSISEISSDNTVWSLDFDVEITQVSEQPNRDSLKLFTRQYTPIVRVYKNDSFIGKLNYEVVEKEFDEDKCVEIEKKKNSEVKYIHKYINELFIGENISQEYFFDIAQQYFLLDFVYRQIKDEFAITNFIKKIKELSDEYQKDQQTVICINCKLRGRKNMPTKINPNLYSAVSHINTLWDKLSKQQDYVIIGNYTNYLTEDELIRQLNSDQVNVIPETISDFFQNDFLFLNNMEFMNETPNTHNWNDRIFSPLLLERIDDKGRYYLKDIATIKKDKTQIFLFQKIKPDDRFYKTEIYLPDKFSTQHDYIQIVFRSMTLLKLKNQEEK